MSDIFEGLNVLEMGSCSVAAAMTGMVFADAGARVIKVEQPGGDRLRVRHPSGHRVWNRGKESLVADLHGSDGQDQVRQLARDADVVIEGFEPGVTAGWGIGADDLRSVNPALVHCSITGYGPTGPYSRLRGYDHLVSAKVGLWSRGSFGHRDGAVLHPVPWPSFGAAMQSVAGIVGALLVRERTGRGQALDATLIAGLDPLDYFVATIAQLMAKKGEAATSDARSATEASRYGVLLCTRDGRFIQTSTLLPHQGRALCDVAGVTDAVDADPRFARMPVFDTAEIAQDWEDLLLEAFRKEDLDHWVPRLAASPDVAFEVAVSSEEGLDHPQIVHNGDVVTIDDPEVGAIRQVGPIGHFSRTPITLDRPAPALGANNGGFDPTVAPSGSGEAPAHPFAGTTIIEFGYFYAMPYALTMAAALGARVIKIEDAKGDPHRTSFGQEVASNKTTAAKESISLDLSTAEGRTVAQKLCAQADAFVTGFRSGIADKLGLGYDELRNHNERLLYVHAAGYGSDGPHAGRALYAQAAQAVAGSFGRQVGYWADPDKNLDMSVMELQAIVLPRLGQVVDGDSNAALGLLAALALGIYHQQRTGEGQLLQTSMIAGNAWAYSDDFCTYDGKPPVPLCDSEYYGTSALERVYEAGDGTWVCVVAPFDDEFATLVDALGVPELARDERFATADARTANDDELVEVLEGVFADRPATEWEKICGDVGAGCVQVSMQGHAPFISFDPVLLETGLTVTAPHPLFGEMVRSAPPIAFSETPGRVGPPCMRGEHNRSLLAEIGYSDQEIERLESSGAVIPPG